MSSAARHAGRKAAPKPIPVDEACLNADTYLAAKAAIKIAERSKDYAKRSLINWLGDETCKTLIDGRVVSRIESSFPAQTIQRIAYTSQQLVISGPPAS